MSRQYTPKIRFKGFTDEWEKKKLEDVLVVLSGRDYKHLSEGSIPVYGTGGYLLSVNKALSYEEDAIGIGRKGTIDKPFILKAPFWTVDTLFYAVPKRENNLEYLLSIIRNINWKKNDESTSIPSLSKIVINSINIIVTKYSEQTKIGGFFKNLDSLIALNQRKYDKLVTVKKALLEKMFPADDADVPQLRFKGFDGAWKRRMLGDFGHATAGISIESEFNNDGKYKVINIGSYSEQSTYTDQGLRTDLTERTKDRILNKNDLTMILNDKTASGRIIGRVLLIEASNSYVFNQRTERIEPNQKIYDSQFLYQLLNAPLIRNVIFKQSQGNTQIYVNWSKIREISYSIPQLPEQTKIGALFQTLDKLISLRSRELEKLKAVKKACLERLFV